MTIVLIRSLILYAVVIASVRLMGKRQLGELQPSELVITILVSNIATLSLEDTGIPLLCGILPILALVCCEVIASQLSLHYTPVRRIISGSPKIIIREGRPDQEMRRALRLSVDDLLCALRMNGIFDLSEVQFAIVETNGSVSVCRKFACESPTRQDLDCPRPCADPPLLVAADGELREHALDALGRDRAWLCAFLEDAHCRLEEVFLLTADRAGHTQLIRKEAVG